MGIFERDAYTSEQTRNYPYEQRIAGTYAARKFVELVALSCHETCMKRLPRASWFKFDVLIEFQVESRRQKETAEISIML